MINIIDYIAIVYLMSLQRHHSDTCGTSTDKVIQSPLETQYSNIMLIKHLSCGTTVEAGFIRCGYFEEAIVLRLMT